MKNYYHSDTRTSYIIGVLLLPMLFILSCEDPEPITEPELKEVLTEEGNFFPFEIAQLSLQDEKLGTGKIQGMLDNQLVEIELFDTVMVFNVPNIAPGVYKLEASHEGKMVTSIFTVKELTLSSSPDQIFQEVVQEHQETIQRLTADAEFRSEPDKAALLKDIQTLNGWMSNLEQHYSNLSPIEKQNFAKTVAANKWWLDEIHSAVVTLSIDAKSLKTADGVDDYETRVFSAARDLITAKNQLYAHVPRINRALGGVGGALLVGAVSANPVGVVVGAAVGVAYVAHRFGVDYTDFNDSLNNFYDTVVEPFKDDEFYSKNLDAPEIISFVSKEEKELDTYSNYRTPYSPDKSSSTPVMMTLSAASVAAEALWDDLSPSLPSPLQPPQALDDIESYSTTQRAVHSNYLEISNISNDNVKLIKKEERDGRLVLTFENMTATVQNFTYQLTYVNINFSPGFSKTISAEVLPSISIVGNWELKTYSIPWGETEGYEPGVYLKQYSSCYNRVLLYEHTRIADDLKFTENTYLRTKKDGFINYNIELNGCTVVNDNPDTEEEIITTESATYVENINLGNGWYKLVLNFTDGYQNYEMLYRFLQDGNLEIKTDDINSTNVYKRIEI